MNAPSLLRGIEDRPLFVTIPGDFRVSFEFFPPKSEAMEAQLWNAVVELAPLNPSFVSVTYGAGGSTRERTHATVARIIGETALVPAAHLTCVAASKDEIADVADRYWEAGGVSRSGKSRKKLRKPSNTPIYEAIVVCMPCFMTIPIFSD